MKDSGMIRKIDAKVDVAMTSLISRDSVLLIELFLDTDRIRKTLQLKSE